MAYYLADTRSRDLSEYNGRAHRPSHHASNSSKTSARPTVVRYCSQNRAGHLPPRPPTSNFNCVEKADLATTEVTRCYTGVRHNMCSHAFQLTRPRAMSSGTISLPILSSSVSWVVVAPSKYLFQLDGLLKVIQRACTLKSIGQGIQGSNIWTFR